MKKVLIVSALLLVSWVAVAQWPGFKMPQKAPAENYELKICNGRVTMVVDAANGARIMSFKYDSTEVLSQNPMPNMYGSTFWTSPQKEWNWPPVREHDMGKYEVTSVDGRIVMTSQVPERIPLRIRKTFSTDQEAGMILIKYEIINEGTEDRSVAPWEVTRVNGEGRIEFNARVLDIWPVGLMAFKQDGDLAYFDIDKKDKQRKINVNGRPMAESEFSFLRYYYKGLCLTKFFPDLKAGEPAPGEDEIQVYVHDNALYCELEAQGAYTLLHPGESLSWSVAWRLTSEN